MIRVFVLPADFSKISSLEAAAQEQTLAVCPMDYAAVEDLFTLARSEVEESFDADSVDGIIPPHSVIEATSAELAKMAKGARAAEVTKACSTLATLAGALSGSNFSASMKARFSHGIASRARGIVDAATAAGSASDPIDAKRAAERFAQLSDAIKRAAEEKDVCAVLLDEVTADADLIAQIDALQAKIDARDHSNVAEAKANHAALSALMEQRVDVFEGKAAALRKAKYPDGAPFAALVCEDAPIAVAVAQDAADATSALGVVCGDVRKIEVHAKNVKRQIAAEARVQAEYAKTAAQQKASALAMLKKALAAEKLAKASELKISAMRAHADAVKSCRDDLEQAKSVCETNQHLAKETQTLVLRSIDAVKGAYAERLEVVQSKACEFDRDLVSIHKSLWSNYVKSRVNLVRNAQEWTEEAAQLKRKEDVLVRQQNFRKAQRCETQRKELEEESVEALSEAAALERKARKIDVRAAPSYLKLADEVEHPYFRVQSEVIKDHEDISLLQIRNALLENPVVSGVALLTPEAKKTLRLVDSPESVSDIARCLFADGDAAPALPKCDLLALATQRTCSVVVPDSLVIPQPVTRAEVMLWMSADAALEAAVGAARAAEGGGRLRVVGAGQFVHEV